jgi:uncharacterized phage infection (PIP) family protein YhgE
LENTEAYIEAITALAWDVGDAGTQLAEHDSSVQDIASATDEQISGIEQVIKLLNMAAQKIETIESGLVVNMDNSEQTRAEIEKTHETAKSLTGRTMELFNETNNSAAQDAIREVQRAQVRTSDGGPLLTGIRDRASDGAEDIAAVRGDLVKLIGRMTAINEVQGEILEFASTASESLVTGAEHDVAAVNAMQAVVESM